MTKYIDADVLITDYLNELRGTDDEPRIIPQSVTPTVAAINAYDNIKRVVENMPAADVEPVRKWIGVQEQLPEPGERTLIYAYDGHSMRISIANYAKKGYGWILSGTTAYWKVKAWQPLPERPKMDGGSTN